MNRGYRAEIAKDTIAITRKKYYKIGRKKITLPDEDYNHVIVIRPCEISKEMPNISTKEADICVVEGDSFAAASGADNCLVMNFANAYTPGGGFLKGANAQEESLCRQSTLYDSINSPVATEMYNYNKTHITPCSSDYMLLSPAVCVFRDIDGELLEEPYLTSVITVPAPDRKSHAKNVPQDELDTIMKNRLRIMFSAAREYGYSSLVLGAWGCGAFANNPQRVAKYFYELLIDENYQSWFERIIFAIIDNKEGNNLKAFVDTFNDIAEIYINEADEIEYQWFTQAKYPPISFNFSPSNIAEENIGYAYGVTYDGCPFMAETWEYGDNQDVAFYLPIIEEYMKLEGKTLINNETGTKAFSTTAEVKGFHVLCVDMIDNGFVEDISVLDAYVKYLCENKLLHFTSNIHNGYAFLLTDFNGQDLIAITISLVFNSEVEATTPLTWTLFPKQHNKKRHLHIVKQ